MLGAQGGEEEGDDSLLQGLTRGSFQGIMQDRLSSHVMEVCFVSPCRVEFSRVYTRTHMGYMCHCANFTILNHVDITALHYTLTRKLS